MVDTLKRSNPYVVSRVNKDMVLYAEVRDGKVIVNSFTPEELKALTGIIVKE